jgi:uncharacterized membrane protein
MENNKFSDMSMLHERLNQFLEREVAVDNEAILSEAMGSSPASEPVIVKILALLGSLIAMALFVAFIFIANLFDNSFEASLLGLLLLGAGIYLGKSPYPQTVRLASGLTAYLLGVFVLVFLVFDNESSLMGVFALCFLLNGIALFFVQHYLFVFVAFLLAILSLFGLASQLEWFIFTPYLLTFLLFLLFFSWLENEPKLLAMRNRITRLYLPVREAILIAIVLLPTFWSLHMTILNGRIEDIAFLVNYHRLLVLGEVLLFLLLLYRILLSMRLSQKARTLGLLVSLLILIPLSFEPQILNALFCLVLGLHYRYTLALVIASVQFVYYTGVFYYDLETTLLYKSLMMMGIGLLFLMAYRLVHNNEKGNEY